MRKKIVCISVSLVLLLSCNSLQVFAGDTYESQTNADLESMKQTLTKAGYSEGTAEALDPDNIAEIYSALVNGEELEIDTCAVEVDNLEALEDLLSYNKEELEGYAESEESLERSIEEAEELLKKSDAELKKQCGLTGTEIKMIRKAEENAELDLEDPSKDYNTVSSGTIASSKLTYTQTVKNNSTKTQPNYKVTLSYSWKDAYLLAPFTDVIIVAWGGGLNSKGESGSAKYYTYKGNLKWNKYKRAKSMSETALPNKGYKFSFPQCYNGSNDYTKTQNGSASLTVYQTKKKGYDTKIISNYCHRVLKANATIGVSASGPSCSVSIGKGYDHSPQKSKNVRY